MIGGGRLGLTVENSGLGLLKGKRRGGDCITVALAGNPNVGKSTLFNALTGMNQHTGNWSGKTVDVAFGTFKIGNKKYEIVDLPGTYSLYAHSKEEEVARDYICSNEADVVAVVCDSTCLGRSLALALQIMEVADNVVVCLNLADEAERLGIDIDAAAAAEALGVPVILTSAKAKDTPRRIASCIDEALSDGRCREHRGRVKYNEKEKGAIHIVSSELAACGIEGRRANFLSTMLISSEDEELLSGQLGIDVGHGEKIAEAVAAARKQLFTNGVSISDFIDSLSGAVLRSTDELVKGFVRGERERRLGRFDRAVMGKWTAYPLMLLLLFGILYLTVSFANYPSSLLSAMFEWLGEGFLRLLSYLNSPPLLTSFLYDGVYTVLTSVVAVMLPPMAIFFPLFTLLEDIGFLPRLAYNLDAPFRCVGACGKQALTMCMGLGCNAAGITGCRIIDTRRERLLAIITNSLVPCNGKFPTIILIIGTFVAAGALGGVVSALGLVGVIVFGILATFLATFILSHTVYRGAPSFFTIELPPYRVPNVPKVLVRSFIDRTLLVLLRAVAVAIPAGAVIWLCVSVQVGGASLLSHITGFLEPIGHLMGMDGTILAAFILGLPANEIVLPIAVMGYTAAGVGEAMSLSDIGSVLISAGWTPVTAVCAILFSLMHWPCSTSLITAYRETKSIGVVLLSIVVPTLMGFCACVAVNLLFGGLI